MQWNLRSLFKFETESTNHRMSLKHHKIISFEKKQKWPFQVPGGKAAIEVEIREMGEGDGEETGGTSCMA